MHNLGEAMPAVRNNAMCAVYNVGKCSNAQAPSFKQTHFAYLVAEVPPRLGNVEELCEEDASHC